MENISQALYVGAGMFWKALWALIFGYLISAGIQVLISRQQMAKVLGKRGVKQGFLSGFFGFISSSCSFAALAASRSVWVKGAHAANAIAFLIASTNLVIELGVVLLVLVGWQFTLGNILLGMLMIIYAYILTKVWFPEKLAQQALKKAQQTQEGMRMEMEEEKQKTWIEKLTSQEGWKRIAHTFFSEWKMVYKEIAFGFLVAGFISVLIPQEFWNTLFIKFNNDPTAFLSVVQNAAVAPFIAFFTFIGSMGNVPLAAMLWSKQASFAGVMSFLGADLVAATVIYIHHKYYGWKYVAYLSLVLYICMVLAGITVYYLFSLFGILPTERPSLAEMVRFKIDYTFWLNIFFGIIGALLLFIHFQSKPTKARHHRMAMSH